MKKNVFMAVSLMGGLLLFASACVKEKTDDEKLRPVGSEIIFSAATSYDNDDRTRTVYTGKDQSGNDVTTNSTIERIDWENNDRVSIVYATGSSQSEYKVTNVLTSNNENDLADVVATGTKLTWASGDNHVFYAMYPTANGNHANSAASLSGTTVSGTIPASQSLGTSNNTQNHPKYLPDMKYAYMVGYANNTCIDGSRVTIPFTPAVTAFNFIFKAASTVTVTGFEMTTAEAGSVGTTLAGDFNFNISGPKMRNNRVVGATWGTVNRTGPSNDNGKTITVSFGQDITLDANQYLDFTVFTLPIAQTGLTIKFYLKNGAATYTKTLDLKDGANSWHSFAAGKKHVVTNDQLAGDNVEYTFDVKFADNTNLFSTTPAGGSKNYTVTSYATIVGSSKIVPIQWEAFEYRYRYGNDPWSTSSEKPSWLSLTTSDTPPESNPTGAQSKSSSVSASSYETAENALKNAAEKGTQSNPYDLSTHKYNGEDIAKTTANCYIITSPGWYKFPLVYGNAYVNGGQNTMAYAPNKSTAGRYLTHFYHHNGTISSPEIPNVNSVGLEWQDADNLITTHPTNSISFSNGYVVFHIEKANIKEGNAVISVRDIYNVVLWSWHIWVTPFVNNVPQENNNVSLRGGVFMSRNLGWCDNGKLKRARQVEVRFRQPDGSATIKTLSFSQTEEWEEGSLGTGPHYQWGRKDPMIPPTITSSTGTVGNKTWYDASGQSSTTIPTMVGPQVSPANTTWTPETAVRNPMTMILVDRGPLPKNTNGWLFVDWIGKNDAYFSSGHYCNLWNYNITTAQDVSVMLKVDDFASYSHGKTVYDPCPVGYTVPLPTELAKLATKTQQMTQDFRGSGTYTWDNTRKGYLINGNLLPCNGYRFYLTTLSSVGEYHNYGAYHSSAFGNTHVPLDLVYNHTSNDNLYMDVSSAKAMARSIRCVPE